ncbi:TIGR03752 family integrating conjugative element protein [Vibrio sp. TBV020]|uniref:TIGR03752 family integrating conjugative element protein n=1 Tax=Vibrio sp. TBV020 TaxID=3137398 RepID=UPI0038CD6684
MTKRNPFLLVLAGFGVVVFGGLIFLVNTAPPMPEETEQATTEPITVAVDDKQLSIMGAFSDAPVDTLRTVSASYQQTQTAQAKLEAGLSEMKDEQEKQVSQLEAQVEQLGARLDTALTNLELATNASRQELQVRQQPIQDTLGHTHPASPYDELGIDSAKQGHQAWEEQESRTAQGQVLVWTEPLDAKQDEKGQWLTPALKAMQTVGAQAGDTFEQSSARFDNDLGTPVYTLHRGSVLADSVSLTALMGRIPMNGQVTDPYPFSMIVGANNLMASGFTLPDIQGAIVTGTVTGDWSLSCVRGVVESIDFIRADGTILSYPEESGAIDSGFDGSSIKTDELGFLADPNGNPCLSGVRISNAPQYLTTKGLLDAATAAANAASIAQKTVSVEGNTTTSSLTGNAMKSAAGESAAAFTSTVSDFIQARMGSTFDIVYVEPGVSAAIHLRKPITLRAPNTPVRVNYATTTQGVTYALP